jgi:hypothetical protein
MFLLLSILAFSGDSAAELAGTWKFEKAVDAIDAAKNNAPMKYSTIQIVGSQLGMGQNCFGQLRKAEFDFPAVFRAMLDANLEEKDLAQFVKKNFAVDLDSDPDFHMLSKPQACRDKFGFAIVAENKLLVPFAGRTMYSFVRSDGRLTSATDPLLMGHAQTQLPFNLNNFYELCGKQIVGQDGKVREGAKCGPVYAPYIALKRNNDKLAQLIGSHNYMKGGAEYSDDYAPPFSKDMSPVYLVLPPTKGLLLVRVEDMETGGKSKRNLMAGVYLSIKEGKVIDQLNSGCNIDEQHFCVAQDGTKLFRLQANGKFEKLTRS